MARRLAFILVLGAFIAAVVAMRTWGGGLVEPRALLAALEQARASGWLLPMYLLLFGLTTLFAPAFVFFVVAGMVWGFWPGCLLGWLGAWAWSQVHFQIGRLLGRERVRQWIDARGFTALRDELEDGGVLETLILRQLPLPFAGVNFAAGASPVRWWRFTLGNSLGLVPGASVYTYSAAAILAGAEGARTGAVLRTLAAAAVMIAVGVSARYAQRRLKGAPAAVQKG